MKENKEQTIRVFVGTDPHMKKAEIALEASIRAHTKSPVEITWMDYARGGLWGGWNIGREHGHPYAKEGWATDFSCFRFAIPEACHFEGRAIYLDADMILIRDIKEFIDYPMGNSVLITPMGFDVILFDCSAFKNKAWWPSIEQMKKSGWKIQEYGRLLLEHQMIGVLNPLWNCCDGKGYDPEYTGLVHFTNMRTQPWKPYPDTFDYPPHPRPDLVDLWEKYYQLGLSKDADAP